MGDTTTTAPASSATKTTAESARGAIASPVDDATYDLLQALTSKLEAIEAYQMYAEDDGLRDLFERLGREEVEHAEALYAALRDRITTEG
jgi:rubrerythrin